MPIIYHNGSTVVHLLKYNNSINWWSDSILKCWTINGIMASVSAYGHIEVEIWVSYCGILINSHIIMTEWMVHWYAILQQRWRIKKWTLIWPLERRHMTFWRSCDKCSEIKFHYFFLSFMTKYNFWGNNNWNIDKPDIQVKKI